MALRALDGEVVGGGEVEFAAVDAADGGGDEVGIALFGDVTGGT